MAANRKRADAEADDVHVLGDVAALRTLFDPLRLRIMGALKSPRTAKELGVALGVDPNKLYYHLRRLQEHDLVAVEDRRAGDERRFFTTSKRLAVDPAVRPSAVEAAGFVGALFGEAQRQIAGLMLEGRSTPVGSAAGGSGGTVTVSQVAATLSPAKLARYQERLRKLVADFEAEPVSTSKSAVEHSLLVALYATPSSP